MVLRLANTQIVATSCITVPATLTEERQMQYHHVRGLAGKWQNHYLYQVCPPLQSKRPVKILAMSCDDVMSFSCTPADSYCAVF